jgi:hypothetical protein
MDIRTETERKLLSLANTQFKFSLIDAAPKIAKEVRILCNLVGITCGPVTESKIIDVYFDDDNGTYANHGCSIRQRVVNGQVKVTFKSGKKFSPSSALEREEVEIDCTPEDFTRMRASDFAEQLKEVFGGAWCAHAPCGKLQKALAVHNRRSTFPIRTSDGQYDFCFDKFYYEAPDGNFSEYFAEIEVETIAKPDGSDKTLDSLMYALCELVDFESHRISKFIRGTSWLRNRNSDYRVVHTLMIDIIGYSLKSADVQKQMIQKLNRFCKDALRMHRPYDSADIVCIPTGDGMIMVFEQDPASLVPVVFDLQDRVRKEHNPTASATRFEFRAGLHSGPVFKFSDVNERLNYAGGGINMAQRVMSPGSAWHLLATQEARENITNANGMLRTLFHPLARAVKTKHNEDLIVYNVHDDMGHGNADAPQV